MAEGQKPIYTAMGDIAGFTDETSGEVKPSPELVKDGPTPPDPKSGPIVPAGQIKWTNNCTLYSEDNNLWFMTPDGKKYMIVMFDPTGKTQSDKPNKLSDGSDGDSSPSQGNTVATGRTVPSNLKSPEQNLVSEPSPTPTNTNIGGTSVSMGTGGSLIPNAGLSTLAAIVPTILTGLPIYRTNFNFSSLASLVGATAVVAQMMGRLVSPEEWNNLIALVAVESGASPQEAAWVTGTICNRARESGLSIVNVINQPGQFPGVQGQPFLTGPSVVVEDSIYQALINHLPTVSHNNYYYEPAERYIIISEETLVPTKNGIIGIMVSTKYVYPGAKWP